MRLALVFLPDTPAGERRPEKYRLVELMADLVLTQTDPGPTPSARGARGATWRVLKSRHGESGGDLLGDDSAAHAVQLAALAALRGVREGGQDAALV
jgi:hypothetical protein